MKTTFLKLTFAGIITLFCGAIYATPAGDKDGHKKPHKNNTTLDTTLCLQLNGKITRSGEKTATGYTVELVQYNKVVDSAVIGNGGHFDFVLRENSWYAVNIKKEGCIDKLISVSTDLPSHTRNYFYKLNFEVEEPLTENEASYLDNETLDFPMAIFAYDQAEDNFYYNEEYSKNIKKVLISTMADEPKSRIAVNHQQTVIRPKW